MPATDPSPELDPRFSDPEAGPTPWAEVVATLQQAELFWISTVRGDGRPHVTPLIAVWEDEAMHFCTGSQEQKARNLERNPQVALTAGNNAWAEGLDVVVEGTAVRITDNGRLQRIADAYERKYGSDWHFDVVDGAFGSREDVAPVFRIKPSKLLAFAKEPHGQTAYRFSAG